jgi:CRISPR system Cascade subunit CasD
MTMRDVIWMRLDAPLQSFGGPMVDRRGITLRFPGRSLLCGLIGNALGYHHGEGDRLNRLQARLSYAVRCDRDGGHLQDFQTVDLGQPELCEVGWTTRGIREDREGGSSSTGTHIRLRDYRVDSIYTVAFWLEPADEVPTLQDVQKALVEPARPLFIGRKPCLPSVPLLLGVTRADTLKAALTAAPVAPGAPPPAQGWEAWWPPEEGADEKDDEVFLYDSRDWNNQVHSGQRRMWHGRLEVRA